MIASTALSGQALAQAASAPPPAPAPANETTDHSLVVGHFGASYFGQFQVPFGTLASNAATQIVGVRYWTSDTMGLDLGLGFLTSSGSTKSGNTTTDNPSRWGFSLKAGVPISLLSAKHYLFFFEPQAIVGYASESIRPTGGDETKNTGYHIALGATAGAEIQFGFIGIPHLALDATLGLGLDLQSATSKTGNNPETTSSSTGLGTAAFAAPWNIFNSNVAARYYF
ncbi:MAG: hypothetical protein ACXVEE_20555 [Polyangiales bacterium]